MNFFFGLVIGLALGEVALAVAVAFMHASNSGGAEAEGHSSAEVRVIRR